MRIRMNDKGDIIDKDEQLLLKAKRKTERKVKIRKTLESTLQTTSKQLIWLFSINGVLWIWCSYVLAFMDKAQIAEALSSNVCTVVIGQMAMYLVTKTVENVSKFNGVFGKSNAAALEREGIVDANGNGVPDDQECGEPGPDVDPNNLN